MNKPEYQNDLSLKSPILLDYEYKRHKVDKMLAILREAGSISEEKKRLAVDIGCSGGFFTAAIAPYFRSVLGVDIDLHALRLANEERQHSNLYYVDADSMRLPLDDGSVDLVICNHVYEHVPDPVRMFREIFRVLADDGICYLGAASRWTPVEPHYHLPFLSWLPKPMAHRYMRLSGKGDYYYENLRSYGGIRKLVVDFQVDDYTLKVIRDPDLFHARDLIPRGGIMDRLPMWIWKVFYRVLPTYILILRK
jgi:SAM-dependent methyltransferase